MERGLYADPEGKFLHNVILEACDKFPRRTAIIDLSTGDRLTYGAYGELVRQAAKGLVAAGLRPGEVLAIYLPNSWEYGVIYHAATLAGAIPTLLNPSYREREVRYQLEDSGAAFLLTDGPLITGMNLGGLPDLRRIFVTRTGGGTSGAEAFATLMRATTARPPQMSASPDATIAALPYSSGTTGLPKGVILSHRNLVANIYQLLVSAEQPTFSADEVVLCTLPLYHIYGLNVVLNPALTVGATLVLMPRFDLPGTIEALTTHQVTIMPVVPPMLNALCQAVERGAMPSSHSLRWVKCGAAPLPPELAHRFTRLTGIPIRQGYGMTEASPVTHMGHITPDQYRPESIGTPLAQTECKVVDEYDREVETGEAGELVMRGPQFMLGYWRSPQATSAVMRDGWYWSGDVVRRDSDGFYYVIDRRKEMIKYKGFSIAPAEIEAVLLEHPAVRDCGVVGRADADSGEAPCAFVVLREGFVPSPNLASELLSWVGEQLTHYKQPREVQFVDLIPHTPSGKILRRDLRSILSKPIAA